MGKKTATWVRIFATIFVLPLLVQQCVATKQQIATDKHVSIVQFHWRNFCYDYAASCPDGKSAQLAGLSYDYPLYKFNATNKMHYPEIAVKGTVAIGERSEIRGGLDLEVAPQIRYNILNAFLFWLSPAYVHNPRGTNNEQYISVNAGLTVTANSDLKRGEIAAPFIWAYSFSTRIFASRISGTDAMPGLAWQLGFGVAW